MKYSVFESDFQFRHLIWQSIVIFTIYSHNPLFLSIEKHHARLIMALQFPFLGLPSDNYSLEWPGVKIHFDT